MTSSSIQDVSGIYYARRTKGTQNGTSDTDDISGMFQNAMNMAKNQSVSRAADQTDAGKNTIQSDTKTAYGMTQNVSRTYPFSNSQKIKETGSDDATVKDNTDTEDKIVKKIADKLQVSEDDVKAAMEELGLSFTDLSIQSNVALLVTELTADGDSVAMLTDADLFATIRELSTELADMLEGIPRETEHDPDGSGYEWMQDYFAIMFRKLEREISNKQIKDKYAYFKAMIENDLRAEGKLPEVYNDIRKAG